MGWFKFSKCKRKIRKLFADSFNNCFSFYGCSYLQSKEKPRSQRLCIHSFNCPSFVAKSNFAYIGQLKLNFVLEQRSQRSALPAGFMTTGRIREKAQNNVRKRKRQIQLCRLLRRQHIYCCHQPISEHIAPNQWRYMVPPALPNWWGLREGPGSTG